MSGSFTRAMQPQPPPQAQGGGPAMGQQLQQAHQMILGLLQQLARVPGIDQAKFQQAVQMFKQGTELIAAAMPKGAPQPGAGAPPPG
jgi:hypothetical protein